jgi:hypothetical protein
MISWESVNFHAGVFMVHYYMLFKVERNTIDITYYYVGSCESSSLDANKSTTASTAVYECMCDWVIRTFISAHAQNWIWSPD